MKHLLNLIYLLAAVAISPKFLYRIIRQNRYRTGWAERLGKITLPPPGKKRIWLHAVSVGEVNSARTLIADLKNALPRFEILVSSTTDTGCARAKALYGADHSVFYFPFDLSFIMHRAFKNIQPDICLLMELELWPNLVQIANHLNVPIVVVNGRLSDESYPRYKLIKPVARWIFSKVTLVLAQTAEYAERFKALGCPEEKVIVTGSLKYDAAQIIDKVEDADELAGQLNLGPEPLWVAGGTGPGEEKIIIETYRKLKQQEKFDDLRLAIVPRKPERFDEVAQLIEQAALPLIRYSQVKKLTVQSAEKSIINYQLSIDAVILGDTMGDLRKFYSLARVIFVGRTLVPMGGSDMMEAAALGKCTIFGPHAFNFKQTVQALLAENGAIEVKDADELFDTMQKCLTDLDFAQQIATTGQEIIRKNQGATKKTIDQIAKFLNSA